MDLPFLANLTDLEMLILLGAAAVFLAMAYMIFKQIVKAIIIAVIAGMIPVALHLLGFGVELSLHTVIWFALAGIATYFVYDVISGWFRIMSILTWPVRRLLRRDSAKYKEAKPEKEEKKEAKEEKEK